MHYPDLTLADITPQHIDTYLQSLQRTVDSIPEIAEEWDSMAEAEQLHFRLDFSRAFGLRRLLGAAYRAGQLSPEQNAWLGDLDRILLTQAAALELVYGSTLRQPVQDLATWGTPLLEQSVAVQIKTTFNALAELVAA